MPSIAGSIARGDISEYVVSHSGRSQYTGGGGGVSACGLAALNCARIVLDLERTGLKDENIVRQMMRMETLEDILRPCLSWSSTAHLDVDEIYKAPIFSKSLKLLSSDYGRTGLPEFRDVLTRLSEAARTMRVSTCVIITRPPEIIACLKLTTNQKDLFVFFDSHPRPGKHPDGAAFIFFNSLDAAAVYLTDLVRFDERLLTDSAVQWQAQLLAHFSAHVFMARHTAFSSSELAEATLEASLDVLSLRARVLELESQTSNLTTENAQLNEEVSRLEDEVTELRIRRRQSERMRDNTSRRVDISSEWDSVTSQPSQRPLTIGSSKGKERYVAGDEEKIEFPVTPPYTHLHASRQGASTSKSVATSAVPHTLGHAPSRGTGSLDFSAFTEADRDAMYAVDMQRRFDRESTQLERQMHELRRADPGTFDCGVCFDTLPTDVVSRVERCGHQFCRDCLRRSVVAKIEEHRYPIACPSCTADRARKDSDMGVVDDLLVQQLGLTENQYETYNEMQMAAFSVILHCRKCKSTMFVDKTEYEAVEIIACPLRDCNHVWCKTCSQGIEIGGPKHSCDGSSELRHLMDQRGWKYCPGCRTPAEKIDGCNHMTCMARGCNTHFCYLCGEAITQALRREDIRSALNAHYRRCHLFQYPV